MGPSHTLGVFHGLPPSVASAVSGRIKIYGGVFRSCEASEYFFYPDDERVRTNLQRNIRETIERFFTVVGVIFADYRGLDPLAGMGILVPLGESTLVIGAWPERDSMDIFLHYCGDDESDNRARDCLQALRLLFRAKEFERSALTPTPQHFVTV